MHLMDPAMIPLVSGKVLLTTSRQVATKAEEGPPCARNGASAAGYRQKRAKYLAKEIATFSFHDGLVRRPTQRNIPIPKQNGRVLIGKITAHLLKLKTKHIARPRNSNEAMPEMATLEV
jgi:hypothetical protein